MSSTWTLHLLRRAKCTKYLMPLHSVHLADLGQPTPIHLAINSGTVRSQSRKVFFVLLLSLVKWQMFSASATAASFNGILHHWRQSVGRTRRAITQHALLGRAVRHTLSLADRRTCCDTVRCRDWWRGERAGLAGALQGLCPVEGKNRNWLPFEWEAVFYSPCGLRLTSQCASEQYLQKKIK